ncbi:hypothetical protein SAMN05216167_112176 [Spirosoma endophyticum]|uniref:Uncharacterized protein n=1 Tax=Spirosoma endophyticum TaxID=662367 RepID=A0A1I1ZP19_9BACT|nr:hypothetical protein SAMN05216167_112176 [Spirosoma endophyticum]
MPINQSNKLLKVSRRTNHRPQLKPLGSVRAMTLKLGSNPDGLGKTA